MKTIQRITLEVLIGLAIVLIFTMAVTACPKTNFTGRLVSPQGRSIAGAIVTIENVGSEPFAVARTNTFGYYTLKGIPNCAEYTLEFKARGYSFEPVLLVLPLPPVNDLVIGRVK